MKNHLKHLSQKIQEIEEQIQPKVRVISDWGDIMNCEEDDKNEPYVLSPQMAKIFESAEESERTNGTKPDFK